VEDDRIPKQVLKGRRNVGRPRKRRIGTKTGKKPIREVNE